MEKSKLRKELISAMDEANTAKEKAKALANNLRMKKRLTIKKDEQLQAVNQKVKTVDAKVVEAFQQTNKYNTILFSWYYKGFELLWRYIVKHPISVDLWSLDLEEVDKEMEMEMDEGSQSATAASEGNALKTTHVGSDEAAA